ncbi:hypothetical protein HN011_005976 [Eciton burchellii]|nr:hypothetical protein HN011_005976 [Eciton burchellii]
MFVAFDDKLACTLRNVHSGVPKSTLSMHINVLLRVDPSLTIPMHPRTINERLLAASSSGLPKSPRLEQTRVITSCQGSRGLRFRWKWNFLSDQPATANRQMVRRYLQLVAGRRDFRHSSLELRERRLNATTTNVRLPCSGRARKRKRQMRNGSAVASQCSRLGEPNWRIAQAARGLTVPVSINNSELR